MTGFIPYFVFSLVYAFTPALVIGGLVSLLDKAAGYAIFIGIFGWLLSNLLIRWANRHRR